MGIAEIWAALPIGSTVKGLSTEMNTRADGIMVLNAERQNVLPCQTYLWHRLSHFLCIARQS